MDDFIKHKCGIILTAAALGVAFMIEGSHLRKIRSKAQNKPKAAHRPLALTEDEESAVIRLTRDGHSPGNYVTQRDVLNFVESQFQKYLTYRWIEYFLQRHADIVCKKTLAPQENPRLQVLKQFPDDYVKLIKEYVPPVPTELIFNIDERGFSDWEERRPKPVLIPPEFERSVLHYPINRAIRHQSIIYCIAAAGDSYCPLLVSAEPSITQVFNHGPRDGIDLTIQIAKSAHVTKEIFESYVYTVLIPAVESNRTLKGCNSKPAISFCDNCSIHCTEDILKKLVCHGVIVLTYPPHTYHIFQVLDVLLFGVLKRAKNHQRRDDELRAGRPCLAPISCIRASDNEHDSQGILDENRISI
jgi:hypothetical protein